MKRGTMREAYSLNVLVMVEGEEITEAAVRGILTSEMVTDSTSAASVSHEAVLWGCLRPREVVTLDYTVLGAQKERYI
jgi:hypothetical protein